jgi:hypothetical protein
LAAAPAKTCPSQRYRPLFHVRLLAPLHVDRLFDFPKHDSDRGHLVAGDGVLVVERGTLGVQLGHELVLA